VIEMTVCYIYFIFVIDSGLTGVVTASQGLVITGQSKNYLCFLFANTQNIEEKKTVLNTLRFYIV
jgi:hypothetical protein